MPANTPARPDMRSVRIGKYLVVSHIATGGMGAVYKARDTENNRDVALKVLAPDLAGKPVMLERFRREARSASKLTHPNIVTLYECGETQGAYYLAMEYVDGIDLQAHLNQKGPLDWRHAKLLLFQAAQALHHAHKQGIVHRDIKPSNFLVTRGNPPVLKMTDLGLAREVDEEEFRVTREGTTVGTVDYMSPEQARDSGAADIRSDLYSLGCTFFHMLVGHAPFAGGSLTERIFRHMGEAPPDVREVNPKVPDSLIYILHKLLAKKPEDRFQTPKELLRALSTKGALPSGPSLPDKIGLAPLEQPESTGENPASDDRILTGNELLAGLLDDGEQANELPANEDEEAHLPQPPRPRKTHHRDGPHVKRRSRADEEGSETDNGVATRVLPSRAAEQAGPPGWLVTGAIATAVLVVLVGGAILIRSALTSNTTEPESTEVVEDFKPPGLGRPTGTSPSIPTGPTGRTPPTPPEPRLTLVETDAPKPDVEALRQELLGGWDFPAPAADATALRLTRMPSGTGEHATLEAALAAAAQQKAADAIITIHDNGPFLLSPAALSGKNLFLRAAPGLRPLLVWDASARTDEALLTVQDGLIVLEGVEIVTRCEAGPARSLAVVRARNSSAWLRDCVVSVSGGSPGTAVVAVRADSDAAPEKAPRLRLHRCFLRGRSLGAVALTSRAARLLVDESLLVGGEAPLLGLTLREHGDLDFRLVRSTLVGAKTAISLRYDPADMLRGGWRAHVCDSVIARSGDEADATLLRLAQDNKEPEARWQSHNSVFVGWPTLLRAGERVLRANQHRAWRSEWRMLFGDVLREGPWPAPPGSELSDLPATDFRTDPPAGPPVGHAALLGEGAIGAPLASLPPSRDGWRSLAFGPFVYTPADLHNGEAPEIPNPGDGLYHGERLDVSTLDVGAYLTDLLGSGKRPLAPTVVIRLYRSDPLKDRSSSPLHVKGVNLVIYLEPIVREDKPGERTTDRQVLNVESNKLTTQSALIEVENGSLELIGGTIQYPNYALALVPPHLLKVTGGSLRVHDCRLLGPTDTPPRNYRGLVLFRGQDVALDQSPVCAFSDTVLMTARTGVQLEGAAARLRLANSVLAAGGDALVLRPEVGARPGAQVAVALERSTVSARQAAVYLHDLPKRPLLAAPLVILSTQCAFVQPFAEKGGLLNAEGEALPQGGIVWQSEKDVFDRRLHFAWMRGGDPPTQPQSQSELARLWGSGLRKPVPDRAFTKTFTETNWAYAALVVPPPRGMPPSALRPEHGADLWQLGVVKK